MTGFKSKREAAQAGSVTKELALKLALEALEGYESCIDAYYAGAVCPQIDKAITAINEALAQPEPVGYVRPEVIDLLKRGVRWAGERLSPRADAEDGLTEAIYTTPPKHEWVGLTDADYQGMSAGDHVVAFWVDRILKEKNT